MKSPSDNFQIQCCKVMYAEAFSHDRINEEQVSRLFLWYIKNWSCPSRRKFIFGLTQNAEHLAAFSYTLALFVSYI